MRLVYLSPLPWNSFSQRPHELVRYFHACTGGQVLWIDPYPTRLPSLEDLRRRRPTTGTGSNTPSWLTVLTPRALPIEPLPYAELVNQNFWRRTISTVNEFMNESTVLGIGKPSAMALGLLASSKVSSSFYDAMDDFPAFYHGISRKSMARNELATVSKVSTVFTSSSVLKSRLQAHAKEIRLVLNACASDRLPASYLVRKPANAPLVVGYVGTIAQWFDWDLVFSLAKENQDVKFRLIGPVFLPPSKQLPNNIQMEAPLPHDAALEEMASFDLGMIPFKRTELTSSVDPIKFYEYRALGLPILSTSFGEMALRGAADGVCLLHEHSDMRTSVYQALAYRFGPEEIGRFRAENSWQSRFETAGIFTNG